MGRKAGIQTLQAKQTIPAFLRKDVKSSMATHSISYASVSVLSPGFGHLQRLKVLLTEGEEERRRILQASVAAVVLRDHTCCRTADLL